MLRTIRPSIQRWTGLRFCRLYAQSPDLEGFRTLKESSTFELIVQKSRFLARAWRVEDASEVNSNDAVSLIKEHSDPKASHNCYAYKVEFESKYSDDGEPSGTGGRPIFAAIESEELDRVCVLVTRYFGGIKLGMGPLGRTYGEAARECLKSSQIEIIRPTVDAEIRVTYNAIFKLHSVLVRFNGKILTKIPTPSGLCVVTFRIEEQYFDDFKDYVAQVTSGTVKPKIKSKNRIL